MGAPIRKSSVQGRLALGGPKVSGALVLDQRRSAEDVLGKAVVDAAVKTMPRDSHAELDALLAVSWCNLATSTDFHYALARATGEDPLVFHRKLVRRGVERTFTTFWRFMTRLMTVEQLVKRVAMVYAKSYDRGTAVANLVEPGVVEFVVSGWSDIPEFEIDALASGAEALVHVSGRASATVEWARHPGGVRFVVRFPP